MALITLQRRKLKNLLRIKAEHLHQLFVIKARSKKLPKFSPKNKRNSEKLKTVPDIKFPALLVSQVDLHLPKAFLILKFIINLQK